MSAKTRAADNGNDSDSDLSLHEEDFADTSVDVGLIDLDLDEMTPDELKLYRIQMRSPFFPCKVGGKPAWLDYTNVPLAAGATVENDSDNNSNKPRLELKCDSCKEQLLFLLQIYAPITDTDKFLDRVEDIDAAFHRVLYVFLCASSKCNVRTVRVLRSQVSRANAFFAYDAPPTTDAPDDNCADQLQLARAHLTTFYKGLQAKRLLNLCVVCGLASSKKCSKCAFAYYCCQAHQLLDWTKLGHKALCGRYVGKSEGGENDADEIVANWVDDENGEVKYVKEISPEHVFPEHEIMIEPEQIDFAKIKREKEKLRKKYDEKKLIEEDLDGNNNSEGMDQDLDALKENDYDKDFERFKKISAEEAEQVVRYERGGEPLWCTKYNKLKETQVPACQKCGAKRIFEFQVTPQLLNYLSLDETKQLNNSIDWAGLYVYTCVRSCSAASDSYATEYIYKQDFVS